MGKIEGLNGGQEAAVRLALDGRNVFLSGGAGTGKSYATRKVCEFLRAAGKNVIVCAPTGVAAVNVGGTTIHRVCGLRPAPVVSDAFQVPEVFDAAEVVVVDEVSCARVDVFERLLGIVEKVNAGRKALHGNPAAAKRLMDAGYPVDDIQVIVVGDFCQLAPFCGKREEYEALSLKFGPDWDGSLYAFGSPLWRRAGFEFVNLTEPMRQQDDEFVDNLNKIRFGDPAGLDWIAAHASAAPADSAVSLCGTNAVVDATNKREVGKLAGELLEFDATVTGRFDPKDAPSPQHLALKVGARVMMLANDTDAGYVNGSLGTLAGFDTSYEAMWVRLDSGRLVEVERLSTDMIEYTPVKDPRSGRVVLNERIVGTYTQFPVRPAYAITIHKSQGMGYPAVSLKPRCWAAGQLYVAISRVESVSGLHIQEPLDPSYLIAAPEVLEFYASLGVGVSGSHIQTP